MIGETITPVASVAAVSNLAVEALGRDYGDGPVLDGLSFSLAAGETLAVIGASGCGKSTLLYLLAGLEKPDRGRVSLHARLHAEQGKDGESEPDIAFIQQDYGLFPWKTVAENLALPLALRRVPPETRSRAVQDMLEELGLAGFGDRYPAQLSGGQRQRVAIGRALITSPDILLMDEPFSSLDALTREHLQGVVLEMWHKRRPTCVLVTHSVPEAVFLGQHIMVLHGQPAGVALWLDNPCFGDPACREREDAFRLTRTVYAALGGQQAEERHAQRSAKAAS